MHTMENVLTETSKKIYNKEEVRIYNKDFYSKNKEKKFYCDLCKCEVSIFNKGHHKATKKHLLATLILEREQFKNK